MKELILDLGIGKGGEYINPDSPETVRIGVDINHQQLQTAQTDHSFHAVNCDFSEGLPFPDDSFNRFQIIFPDGAVTESLIEDEKAWQEIQRVLSKEGLVETTLENPLAGRRFYSNAQGNIGSGYSLMAENSRKAGLNTRVEENIDPETIKSLGTDTSQKMINFSNLFKLNFFKIISEKK